MRKNKAYFFYATCSYFANSYAFSRTKEDVFSSFLRIIFAFDQSTFIIINMKIIAVIMVVIGCPHQIPSSSSEVFISRNTTGSLIRYSHIIVIYIGICVFPIARKTPEKFICNPISQKKSEKICKNPAPACIASPSSVKRDIRYGAVKNMTIPITVKMITDTKELYRAIC